MSLEEVEVIALYRRYFPMLIRKCHRMLGDSPSAQDVAQETFTRLWRHRATLADPAAVVAWLYVTATRLAVDRIRRGATETLPEIADDRAPDRISAARDLLVRIQRHLSAEELELLVLARLDRLTHPELARVLQTSERTVRRRLADLDITLTALGAVP